MGLMGRTDTRRVECREVFPYGHRVDAERSAVYDRRAGKHARAAVLPDEHPLRGQRFGTAVRVGVRNIRLTLAPDAQLQEVPKRAVTRLPTHDGLDAAAMDEVLAGQDRWRPHGIRTREIERLDQVEAPIAADAARAAPGEHRLSRGAVPGDINGAHIARRRPGKDIGMQGRCWELARHRPAIALAGRD